MAKSKLVVNYYNNVYHGWMSIVKYMYTLQKVPKKETWVCFMEKFQELPQNVQALIIEKLHGNTKTWCMQHKSSIINA